MGDKKALKFLKKHWIAIWLIVVSTVFFAVVISNAAYQNTNNKLKRVIAPSAGSDGLFSSNFLEIGSGNIKTAYFKQEPYTYNVDIRNFNAADRGTVFKGDIPYTLRATLSHKNGQPYNSTADAAALSEMTASGRAITISLGSETITLNGTNISAVSSTHTLSGTGDSGINSWNVSYTNIPMDQDFCVTLEAVPASSTKLESLSATIIVANFPVVHYEGWACELAETGTLLDYDAFNYTISGTGAKVLRFSYNANLLTVNPSNYGFDNISAPASYSGEGHDGWETIVITVSAASTVNRYDFQVYKKDRYVPSSFDQLKPNESGSYIEFTQSDS